MACHIVALDKRPGVRLLRIGETLLHAIAKLLMRSAGDQVKKVCGILQLCAGLEAGIEGDTHSMARRQHERHASYPGVGADEGSEGAEDENVVATVGMNRSGEAERVEVIREVPQPPGYRSTA